MSLPYTEERFENINILIKSLLTKNPKIRKLNFDKIKSLNIFNDINFDLIAKMNFPPPYKPNINESFHFNDENFLNFIYKDDKIDYNNENNCNLLIKKGIFDEL